MVSVKAWQPESSRLDPQPRLGTLSVLLRAIDTIEIVRWLLAHKGYVNVNYP